MEQKLEFEAQKLALERERFAFDQMKHLRERWTQEDALINQKMGWWMTSQAFIGAGYAFLKQQADVGKLIAEPGKLVTALPVFAALICLAVAFSVFASHSMQDEIRKMAPEGTFGTKHLARGISRVSSILLIYLFFIGWSVLSLVQI